MSRERLLAPAIALAREGVEVTPFLHESLVEEAELLRPHPSTAALLFPGGRPLAPGDRLVQPELARTLERIAAGGSSGFYEGETAERIVADMRAHGGLLTREDLSGYRSVWREPFTFAFEGLEIVTPPLPSSGGIVLAQILGLLDVEAVRAAGFGSAEAIRLLTEAERLAYADRNHHLGDPDFVDVPVAELVSPAYLARRRALLPSEGAGSSEGIGPGRPEAEETTHYCVVDAGGNAVAITTTLNGWYGMGAIVPGAGFLLNNEMDDFSAKPGVPNLYGLVGTEANSIAPGKRMLSSMTPTIVRRGGEFHLTMGTPGGSTIITTVLQILLGVELFGLDVREAVDAGRVHHQWLPDVIRVEPRFPSPDTRAVLEAWGYRLEEGEPIGRACAIRRRDDGSLAGWADRRGIGKAAGL
jgi:gamma-glutamyltranspeptidase/glutathione hydrolase